jgi:hypothetical protein
MNLFVLEDPSLKHIKCILNKYTMKENKATTNTDNIIILIILCTKSKVNLLSDMSTD